CASPSTTCIALPVASKIPCHSHSLYCKSSVAHTCCFCCVSISSSKVRSRGYLLIYRSTRHLKRLPLFIQSTGNAALLLILSAQHSFPEYSKTYLYFILAILGLELICSLICLVIYTVKVSNFNQAKARPDIIEEEKMYSYPSHVTSEIGFRESSSLEEIVEKQADVIEYLQRHNALLSKKLLTLTSQQLRD
uniref:Transmembrane protein 192 n=1 Tax=Sphenodon punctatus TaxID=8508 RepID=A0A8D0GGX3_SPHPU